MMKARAGTTVLFGLSEMNLRRLREGEPIMIDMRELGIEGRCVIFYGETEQKMRDEMRELIGPDTIYKDDIH